MVVDRACLTARLAFFDCTFRIHVSPQNRVITEATIRSFSANVLRSVFNRHPNMLTSISSSSTGVEILCPQIVTHFCLTNEWDCVMSIKNYQYVISKCHPSIFNWHGTISDTRNKGSQSGPSVPHVRVNSKTFDSLKKLNIWQLINEKMNRLPSIKFISNFFKMVLHFQALCHYLHAWGEPPCLSAPFCYLQSHAEYLV